MPFPLDSYKTWANQEDLCYVVNNGGFIEPTSVLDSVTSLSPLLSSSTTTLSSSHGGFTSGGGGGVDRKCDEMGFEDLDGVLSCSPALIMTGDVVNPSSEFLGFDPGSRSDPVIDNDNPLFGYGFPLHEPPPLPPEEEEEAKFQITPDFFSGGLSLPAKRHNPGQPVSQKPDFHHNHHWVFPFSDPGLTPPPKISVDHDHDLINQLFNAAELIGKTNGGDNILAQEILARLNHNLINNNLKLPIHRAALYIIEALQSLLQHSSSSLSTSSLSPPQTLILKIAAYKAFSETSPFLQFVNFTSNQMILESIQGFDRIHIVDFDIGFGNQWASLIQELAGKKSIKVTAFASPSTISDEFELRFTEDNLRNFAGEIEIELLNLEILLNPSYWPHSLLRSSEKEAIAVNLPISSVISGYLPLILRFLKQISPNVVVCSDGNNNNDAPFPNSVIHALQYYTSLLESLDVAGNRNNQEVTISIERFYVQPSIQKLLTNHYRWMEKSPPWRSLFGQYGFFPVTVSQTTETQAEYLLQRSLIRGFELEKRQSSSSLVLCWQKKELVNVSSWKC